MTHFGWNFLLVGVYKCSPSQKSVLKKPTGKFDKHFVKNRILAKKSLPENQNFAFFSKFQM